MGASILLVRFFLAAVFAVAGATKLASISRTRDAVLAFGARPALANPLTGALIAGELAVAAALASLPIAYYGAVGALALSSVFALAIAGNLLRDRHPDCNCFGQLHSTPIGWTTFARAVALAVLAAIAVIYVRDPRASVVTWPVLRGLDWALIALAAAAIGLLAVIAALLGQVLRQQGRILLRFEAIEQRLGMRPPAAPEPSAGLAPESPAPEFVLTNLNGSATSLRGILDSKRPAVLVFAHPGCGPCQALLPDLERWQKELRETLTLAIVSEGTRADNQKYAATLDPGLVLIQQEREVAREYEVYGTPAALVVSADGRIATFQAQGAESIRGLLRALQTGQVPMPSSPSPPLGAAAPEFSLEVLNGGRVAASDLRGKPALLLFWNQHCGFCQQMLPDLRAWAAAARAGAPRLLVVANGTADDYRDWDVTATVALDPGGRVAGAFGAQGTPMGILIDAEGRTASAIATGARAFFDLARRGEAGTQAALVAAAAG